MNRSIFHVLMLLPILAATMLTYSIDPVKSLSPDQVVSWSDLNDVVAANAAESEGANSEDAQTEETAVGNEAN